MIILPHLVVMYDLKSRLKFLRDNPEHLTFLLDGYCVNAGVAGVFGGKTIDQAINWMQNHEFHFNFGYRMDATQLPSITILYEGGRESQQFIGDAGEAQAVDVEQKLYAKFDCIGFTAEGWPIVAKEHHLENRVWRTLVIKNGTTERAIKGFETTAKGDLVLVLDVPLEAAPRDNWSVLSSVKNKTWIVGTSLDSIKVKVYLTIAGEPELCEMLGTVIRYVLKQSRLALSQSGLEQASFSHGPLSKNSDIEGDNIWMLDFTISGMLTDRWIMSENKNPDRYVLDVDAESLGSANEVVDFYGSID